MGALLERSMEMGEPATVRELFEEHHQHVLQAAYRITGSAQDAEDVLQTVFTRLLRRSELPELGDKARAYLHRAAVNAALDVVRGRRGLQAVPIEFAEPVLKARDMDRPDRMRSDSELGSWLREALSRLRPKSAELFVLRFVEGYSNQEIADLLGTTVGTVAVTLHRTRSRLRREITGLLGGMEHA